MTRFGPWLLILLALTAASTGCVRRRMTIRTNPPGAMVYIDDQQIGTTPVSSGYTYYGTRTVTLVKDGFETLTVKHDFDAPWYEVPPIDFISENVIPREIHDDRVLDFTLVPQRVVPTEELWRNAENLRRGAQQGYVVPHPAGGRDAPIGLPPILPPPGAPAGTLPWNAPLTTGDSGHRGPWR